MQTFASVAMLALAQSALVFADSVRVVPEPWRSHPRNRTSRLSRRSRHTSRPPGDASATSAPLRALVA